MVKKLFGGLGITILGATLAFALTGCAEEEIPTQEGSSSQESTAVVTEETAMEEGDTVTIGGILPLTGEGAAYGDPMQKVAQIALDKVNAAGGVNGKKLSVIWEDGKCNGADAANAANKLINVDKVKVIYGGFCSSETLAIAPIAEKAGVVVLSPGSSSPDITNAGDFIFRNYPSDASQGKVLAEYVNSKGLKKVAILSEQNDYTLGIQKVFEEKFKELGGTVEVQTYLPQDSDFRTPLVKLKAGTPDALFINPQTPAKADLAFKQVEELQWDVQLIGNDVVAGYQDLISKYKDLVDGMIVAE
ncbi:MAG TPA: ABC transporter substrate-binding protein, partial [Candidatus Gracilibacteria bacterium]|nr:ABC transporter substrate-binding protein [Candidatus Gracilibacteria bacterium]